MAYSLYEAAAINRFAQTYLNTGCDEDEAYEVAKNTYDREYASCQNENVAVERLYFEMERYRDM